MMATRGMAMDGMKGFKEREHVIEDYYFTKEDERILNKLLVKMKSQTEKSDVHAVAGVKTAEMSSLRSILSKYSVSDEDYEKLLKWKHVIY